MRIHPTWPLWVLALACGSPEVVTEVEALKVDIVEGESVTVEIFGTQWVDGLRIYEVPSFAVRVRAG